MYKQDFLAWYQACQQELIKSVPSGRLKNINSITSSKKPYLTKFKYDDYCDFSQPYQLASRGSTRFAVTSATTATDCGDNSTCDHWSWCFNKFFNRHELPKQLGVDYSEFLSMLRDQGFDFFLTPKWDGSCIQLVADTAGILHIHTLGSLSDDLIMEAEYSFRDTVLKLLPVAVIDYLKAHPYLTLLAEVCSPHNKIITNYSGVSSLYYLSLVDSVSGLPTSTTPAELLGVIDFHPQRWRYTTYSNDVEATSVNSDTDMAAAISALELDAQRFGHNPEELIVYASKTITDAVSVIDSDANRSYVVTIPIVKIKRQEYLLTRKSDQTTLLQQYQNSSDMWFYRLTINR